MKHARADYNRIQDPAGKIPDDEPVLLLRGQDVLAPAVLRYYASLVDTQNGDPDLANMVRSQAALMEQWLVKKIPDLPRDMRAEIEALNRLMPNHELVISEPYSGGDLIEDAETIARLPIKPVAEGALPTGGQADKFPRDLSPTPHDAQGREITPIPTDEATLDRLRRKE